jgi:probable rRNA maturation factor
MRSEVLGDLVICAPVVRREARAQRKPERAHWAHMVVHGILHLRGYDHLNRRDATVMETKEIRILKELGFANPYLS